METIKLAHKYLLSPFVKLSNEVKIALQKTEKLFGITKSTACGTEGGEKRTTPVLVILAFVAVSLDTLLFA